MSNLSNGGLTRVLNYIKTWVNGLLSSKSDTSHTHTKSQITDFPSIPSKTSDLTNDSGFLTAHQSLSNYVDRSSEQAISGNKTFNDRTRFKKGSYMHTFGGGQDVGYTKFATITIDAQYQDCTATLVIMNRSYLKPVCVHIKFYGVDHVDPNIDTFTTDATDRNANDYYLVKADTSTWDLYVYKTAWNVFTVLDFWQSQNNAIHVTFTWKDEFISSLPSGNIKATFSAYNYNDLSNKPTIPSKTSELTNDSGFLTSHQSLSSRVAIAGDTMTGTLNLQTEDNVCLNLRPSNSNYYDTISVQTAGNEAVVFATKNSSTSWMFINGEDSVTNHAQDRWQSLTPGLQIKSNKVAIGKLIANGSNLTYPLEVNGTILASNVKVTNNSSNGVVFGSYRVYVG